MTRRPSPIPSGIGRVAAVAIVAALAIAGCGGGGDASSATVTSGVITAAAPTTAAAAVPAVGAQPGDVFAAASDLDTLDQLDSFQSLRDPFDALKGQPGTETAPAAGGGGTDTSGGGASASAPTGTAPTDTTGGGGGLPTVGPGGVSTVPGVPIIPVPATPPPPTTVPQFQSARLEVNGVRLVAGVGAKLPTQAPVLELTAFRGRAIVLRLLAGRFANGSDETQIAEGDRLTLENVSTGERFTIVVRKLLADPPPAAATTEPTATVPGSTDTTTTSTSTSTIDENPQLAPPEGTPAPGATTTAP